MSTEQPAPRRRFGAAYWTAMLLGLILILAGALVGFLGPELIPPHHPAATAGLATRASPAK